VIEKGESMDMFNRLAPYIQEYIYNNRWEELREVQVAACDIIFNTDNNLLLSSGTASGKTEAAFLPTLTKLYEEPSKSVGILYISPLKALINDQFLRLDLLLQEANIPVCKWHGDASTSAKKKLLKNPKGVLQITPESLESLLVNRREACINLFSDLRFIIIDEVHYFMDSLRGTQLLCQMERIQRLVGCSPRRIGLSATLGNYENAEKWLNCGSLRECSTPIINGEKRKLRILMERFATVEEGEYKDSGVNTHIKFLYQKTLDKKAIIFALNRAEIENSISLLKNIAEKNHTNDIYRVHHGSISAILREETEREMKNSDEAIVTGATVTLELGIDLGSLDQVVQIGAPSSASSFTQRIGRCGRRGQPAELLFTFMDSEKNNSDDPLREINWDFIKTIAIINLFLEERWVEPIEIKKHPYGLVYHQTMSFLLTNGEVSAAELAQNILTLEAFSLITKDDYKLLLKHLIEIEQLEKTERGGIMIGLKGEMVVSHFDFYTVFESQFEYSVKEKNKSIGSVSAPYPIGNKFSLAGRTWETVEINEKTRVLFVKQVKGYSKTMWNANTKLSTHTYIYQKMKEVLDATEMYAFLSKSCQTRLREIRKLVKETQISKDRVIALSENIFGIFPWLGTKQLTTLYYALGARGIKSSMKPGGISPIYLETYCEEGEEYLRKIVSEIFKTKIESEKFELPKGIEIEGKYNQFIPKPLLRKQFIEDYLVKSI